MKKHPRFGINILLILSLLFSYLVQPMLAPSVVWAQDEGDPAAEETSTEEPTLPIEEEPTETPTPTQTPTDLPTEEPTEEPTLPTGEQPTETPTDLPTEEPTVEPTEEPTETPTLEPTAAATETPAAKADIFVPRKLQSQLSSDGKQLMNGAQAVVYVADSEKPVNPLRIPAPFNVETADPQAATSTYTIDYVAAGGTDLWGEPCFTFPNEAKAAFNAAAAIWANTIQSPVPITIRTCWANLGSSSTLGYSGGGTFHRDFTNAPLSNTWYGASLANSLAGSDLNSSNHDMHITYNTNFSWYYGTDGNTPGTQYDLESVVLHEIAHGLNFSGSMSVAGGSGSYGYGTVYPNVYDTFTKDGSGNNLTNTGVYANPSTALGTALTSGSVWFHGANAMAANGGSRVKLYAPATWAPGSSYSHLDYSTFNNTANQLMVYAISAGESIHDPGPVTKGLFKDLGWASAAAPDAATLISPSVHTSDTTPTYIWNAVSDSTYYYLSVNGPSGNVVLEWYTAAQAGCSSGTGTCSVTPTTVLAGGEHSWKVQTWNSVGVGPWSASMPFNVDLPAVPGLVTLIAPSGAITDTTPSFQWNAVIDVDLYYLYVTGPSGGAVSAWYSPAVAGCSSGTGTCTITPTSALAGGAYTWQILPYNSVGAGPWSAPLSFSLPVPLPPGQVTLIAPSGAITDTTPDFQWNAVSDVELYYLYATGPSGGAVSAWYSPAQAGCSSGTGTCTITPTSALTGGAYTWQILPYNSAGVGPWSAVMSFSLPVPLPPGQVTLIAPSGAITDTTPDFQWNAVSGVDLYYLYATGPSGGTVSAWYSPAVAGCSSGTGTCTITPTSALTGGAYKWQVLPYNSVGVGPWSAEMSFSLPVPLPPGLVTLIGPSGAITDTTPDFQWNAINGIDLYYLYATGPSGGAVSAWYSPTQAGCSLGIGSTCSITPTSALTGGSYTWQILPYNSAGVGPWSAPLSFSLPVPLPPDQVTLIAPTGAITDTTPAFVWNAVSDVDLYYLYATGPSGGTVSAWYSPAVAGCSSGTGTCTITPTSALTGGAYTWQILSYNSVGVGPWSAEMSFSLPIPLPPDQVTLIAPSGTISTSTPTYSWNAVSDVELYYLYVNGPMGNEISSWYSPTQAGCSSGTGTCSIDTGKFLTGGPHTWQVLSYNSVGTGPWSAEMSFTPPGIWSEFNGDATGWWIPNDDSTLWYLDSNFVYTDGPTDGSFFTSLYNEGTYDNLVYSADFYRSGNSGWANTLLIRGNPATLDADGAWTNGYLFHYSDGGFYTVWKMVNGVQTALQSWTYTSAIVTGPAWNTLTAWAQGDQLWFSINGTWVWNGTDTSFTSGNVGVGMAGDGNDTLFVDWAHLSPLQAASTAVYKTETRVISAEQAALNAAANLQPLGSNDFWKAPSAAKAKSDTLKIGTPPAEHSGAGKPLTQR